MDTYCTICGAKEEEEWSGYYLRESGEKKYNKVCSNKPCEHSGHNYIRISETSPSMFKSYSSMDECSRCGRKVKDRLLD
jgi:hypothetical protein